MPETSHRAVFLSYASQDADAARRICDALRSAGVEVWFDQNDPLDSLGAHGLVGGDAWDAKIRQQIASCALFVPIISAATQARSEGYFRLEWKLAVDRSHLRAQDEAFLLPVVIDDIPDTSARVPAEFRAVQWTRLRTAPQDFGGRDREDPAVAALVARVAAILRPSWDKPPRAGSIASIDRPSTPPTAPQTRRTWLALAAATAVAVGAALIWKPWRAQPGPAGRTESITSVAVLPFVNLSGDQEQEYFSEGLTEEILNALARERDLRVVPRASAFSFKGRNLSLPEIARALNVSTIVEGSVQRAGNQVRIRCTLTRVADGFAEALPTLTKDFTEIFALQDEVARQVVAKLTSRAHSSPAVAVLTRVPEAYEAFLRGRQLMTQNSIAWPEAVTLLQKSVALDPQFALAWAYLGNAAASVYWFGYDSTGLTISERAIATALRLQPELPQAHHAKANFLRYTGAPLSAVEAELTIAERHLANDAEVIQTRGVLARLRGQLEESTRQMERAAALDPRNVRALTSLGVSYVRTGRYADADAVYQKAYAILPSPVLIANRARVALHSTGNPALVRQRLDEAPESLRTSRYWSSRSIILHNVGDYPGALQAAEKIVEEATMFGNRSFVTGRIRLALGDTAGARRDFLVALPLTEQQRTQFPGLAIPHATLALIYLELGRKDEAIASAEKATQNLSVADELVLSAFSIEARSSVTLAYVYLRCDRVDDALSILEREVDSGNLRRHPLHLSRDWDSLKDHPRFRALLQRAAL